MKFNLSQLSKSPPLITIDGSPIAPTLDSPPPRIDIPSAEPPTAAPPTATLDPLLTASPSPTMLPTATEMPFGPGYGDALPTVEALGPVDNAVEPIVTAVATEIGEIPPEPPLPPRFTDTFDNPNSGNWIMDIYAGWEMGGRSAVLLSDVQTSMFGSGGGLVDVSLEAQMTISAGGIHMHLRGSGVGYYRATLYADGRVELRRTDVVLASAVLPTTLADVPHQVRFSAIGDILRVTVDGALVLAHRDAAPLPGGTLWLEVAMDQPSRLLVDNVVVNAVEPAPVIGEEIWVTPPLEVSGEAAPIPASESTGQGVQPLAATPSWITFASNYNGISWDIYIIDANNPSAWGSVTGAATGSATDLMPEFSSYHPGADVYGARITFVSNHDGNWEIYSINRDGSGLVRSTYNIAADEYPDYSPESERIVFQSNRSGNDDIWVMGTGVPGGIQNLTNTPNLSESRPEWALESEWIAFDRQASNGYRDIYRMLSDGSSLTLQNMPNGNDEQYGAAWSSAGDLLAFVSQNVPQNGVQAVRVAPTNNSSNGSWVGATGTANRTMPAFSPDDQRLVTRFSTSTNVSVAAQLSIVRRSDGAVTALTTGTAWNSADEKDPDWEPQRPVCAGGGFTAQTAGVCYPSFRAEWNCNADPVLRAHRICAAGSWNTTEINILRSAVSRVAFAFQSEFGAQTPGAAFWKVFYEVGADGIQFRRVVDPSAFCATTKESTGTEAGMNFRALVTCLGPTTYLFVAQTITHELGHVFVDRTSTIPASSYYSFFDRVDLRDNASPSIPIMGVAFRDSQNRENWTRGARGWGSHALPGRCDGSISIPGAAATPYQQNACDVIDADFPGLTLVEREEAAADMFLNWIYDVFRNAAWANGCTVVSNCLDSGNSGDIRRNFMSNVMNSIEVAFGW